MSTIQSVDYISLNERQWNFWSDNMCAWTQPISHEEYHEALKGNFDLFLTPLKPVPKEWYYPLENRKVLALAAGGGQQSALLTAGGASVSVLDFSVNQLAADAAVAKREGYEVTLVRGDITKRFPFNDGFFDMIIHPVSNSYIEDLRPVWDECFRVLKTGGTLISGFANPTIYLFRMEAMGVSLKYQMPYNPLKLLNSNELKKVVKKDGIQFGHSFEEQIAGQLSSGFVINGFFEDHHPSDNSTMNYDTYIGKMASFLSQYMPIYFVTRALKKI